MTKQSHKNSDYSDTAVIKQMTLEQPNVHSWFNRKLKKWWIGVLQGGISAPQVIRK